MPIVDPFAKSNGIVDPFKTKGIVDPFANHAQIPGQTEELQAAAPIGEGPGLFPIKPGEPVQNEWAKSLLGGAENALAQTTGFGAMGLGLATAGMNLLVPGRAKYAKSEYENVANAFTYSPRTEVGKEDAKKTGELINRYLLPMAGIHMPTALSTTMPKPKGKEASIDAATFKANLGQTTTEPSAPTASIPKLLETNPGEVPEHYGYQENPPVSPSQLKVWADRRVQEEQQQRYAAAQAAIDARNKSLEQGVAENTPPLGKDYENFQMEQDRLARGQQSTANALEAQPTGYDKWLQDQQNQRGQPGNNTPVDFKRPLTGRQNVETPLREDINTFPEAIKDAPYQYEGGVDPGTFFNDPKTLPLEVQDILQRGMHDPNLTQQVLDALNTKLPDQVAREKALPIDVLERLNTPIEPPPHASWAKPIAGLNMGKGGGQRGALNMSAFTEGFKGLNKWLSKLTDEPWVRSRFPASLYESNKDGTPRIMLHGSRQGFNDTPKATPPSHSFEGFHAGYAGPASMKASIGVKKHSPGRQRLDQTNLRSGYTSTNLEYVNTHFNVGGGAIYPVVIRKGNYPHLGNFDAGTFDPTQLHNLKSFQLALAKASDGRYGFYDVKDMMDNWWATAKHMNDRDMILRSWSRMLKDQFGIDGFYYKNAYESSKKKLYSEAERIIARRDYVGLKTESLRAKRLTALSKEINPAESFVTWNNDNIRSLYDEPIQPTTKTGSLNKGLRGKQSGKLDFEGIAESVKQLASHFDNAKLTTKFTPTVEDILSKHPGIGEAGKDLISRGKSGDEMLKGALANIEQQRANGGVKDSKLWPWAQSGMNLAAEKLENIAPWVRDVSRWVQYTRRKQLQAQREVGAPLNRALRELSQNERDVARVAMIEGMKRGEHLSEGDMLRAGATPRTIAIVKKLQDYLEQTLQRTNQVLKEQGRDPLNREDAYLNSLFHGDYTTFVRAKNADGTPGSLVWPVHSRTKAQAELARLWLKDHFKDHPDIIVPDQVDHIDMSQNKFMHAPKDQLRAFANMLDLLKDPQTGKLPESAKVVREALQEYIGQMGENYKGTNKFRVDDKYNRRGFEGDKPWLSDKENTSNFWEAQIKYIENSHHWAALSEMMNEVKKVLSDETLNKEQPNVVAMVKAMLARETGISTSMFKPLEAWLGKGIPSFEKDLLLKHRENPFRFGNTSYPLTSFIHALKAAGYFGLISNSVGYMLATPLQAIPTAMYWYSHLHQQGYIKDSQFNPKAWSNLMKDLTAGFTESAFLIKMKDPFYREAMDWAEQNTIATNILHEDMKSFSETKPTYYAKWWTNATMTRPDQLTRVPLFLSFANTLWKGGKFTTKEAAFQRAAEIVDHTMVSMRAEDRPLVVDKLGAIGDGLWMMKAPTATLYNTFSHAIGNLDFNNPKTLIPIVVLGAATLSMGGVHNAPIINELEGAAQAILGIMAKYFPATYASMIKNYPGIRKWMSFKEAMITIMPDGWMSDVVNWGVASKVLGPIVGKDIDMSTRFGQSFIDIEHPMGAVTPLAQEAKEWLGAANVARHRDMRSFAEGAYAVSPPLAQGIMEMSMPQFRANTGNPNQFLNPRDLRNPAVRVERDEGDKAARWMGMTSLDERKKITKNMYANNENFRRFEASQAAMKELFVAIMDKKPDNIRTYAEALSALDPELKTLETFIQQQAEKNHMTPQQYATAHANTLTQVMNVMRRAQMDQNHATKP